MSLGGPPRAQAPGGRAIARQGLPRDRAAYGVSSHSGNARYRGASGTVDDSLSSLATAAQGACGASVLDVHTSTCMNSLRLERVVRLSELYRPSPGSSARGHRPGDAWCCALRSRAGWLRTCSPLVALPIPPPGPLTCPLRPSPADHVRRCGSRLLRNLPAAGPPLRSGPGASKLRLRLSRRPPHFRTPAGNKRRDTRGLVSWLLSDQ
jgi:hypothetical protein